jgi:hypothetical protein
MGRGAIGADQVSSILRCLLTALLSFAVVVVAIPTAVSAGDCQGDASSAADAIELGMICAQGPGSNDEMTFGSAQSAEPVYVKYQWASVCVMFDPSRPMSLETECTASFRCDDPRERVWELWGRLAGPEEIWRPLGTQCLGSPTDADIPLPEITPGLVLNEIRRIGLPTLETHTQPQDKTLVNFDTIFYTEPHPFSATVTLLGQQVDITAEPTSYTWHHGDGTDTTTRTPGAPYPAKDITHRYTRGDTTVRPRVDVTYTARFRVNGGAWQDIDETVTIAGPQTSLRITEAAPVLSGDYS